MDFPSVTTIIFLLYNISAVILVLIQSKILTEYKNYGIRRGPEAITLERTILFWKTFCLVCLIGLEIIFEVLPYSLFSSDLPQLNSWIHLFVILPLLTTESIVKSNWKLSTPDRQIETISYYIEKIHWGLYILNKILVLEAISVCRIIQFTLTLILIVSLICSPLVQRIQTWQQSIVQEGFVSPKSENGEPESPDSLTFSELCKRFYLFKSYFVPSTALSQLFLILFICSIGIDTLANFYNGIYSRRILDSISFDSSKHPKLDNTTNYETLGFVKLEFRWDYIVILAVIQFVQGTVSSVGKYFLKVQVEKACCRKLQVDLFRKLHNLSLRWHLENRTNEVFSLVTSAPNILSDILSTLSWQAPIYLRTVLVIGYLVSNYSFKLTSVILITAVFSTAFDLLVLSWREKAVLTLEEEEKEVRNIREASFENFETVKLFTNEEYEVNKFSEAYFQEQDRDLKIMIRYDLYSIIREFFQGIAELGVILLVVHNICQEEGLTTGDYVYFSGIFSDVMSPFEYGISFYRDLKSHGILLGKVLNILMMTPEITDEPNALVLEVDSINGATIEFRDVDFSYLPERKILSNINFKINGGETVAFVGHSGCGKSTITKLLFRFYDPTAGEILVNGKNIRKVQCLSVRKLMGIVPQDIVLFDDTIKENIRYGNLSCSTDEEIIEAAKSACLHDKVDSFPDKYETEVGSRGLKLSGGEKQRVAIARTILKNPPIIILDEATSSLDTETEKQIQSSLENLCKNRTTVIIAHRLSTIVHADKIIVLKDGTVAEEGKHEELLAKGSHYATMWNQQFNSKTKDFEDDISPTKIKRKRLSRENEVFGDFNLRNQRRQIFSSRLKETVWSVMQRHAFSVSSY